MKNKKGFILYADMLESVNFLPDEDLGKFFRAILQYQNGENPEISPNLKMGFEFLKVQFKRDSDKWKTTQNERSESGRIGNLKRWHEDLYLQLKDQKITLEEAENIANNRKASHSDKSIANIADNVNVNVSVIDKGNITNPITQSLILKTPSPRGCGGVKKISELVGGVGVKRALKVIDITGQLSGLDIQEVEKAAPSWDIEYLAKVYIDGINSGAREAPNSITKAFPKWCEKYTKGQPPKTN